MNMNIISKYLQFLRKSNNYTQDDLAKKLGISRQAVPIAGLILSLRQTLQVHRQPD